MSCCKLFLLLTLFSFLEPFSVSSVEFEVGDDRGWVVPTSEKDQIYNDWASDNRFQINDTVRFKFVNDSVMEVTEKEYESCFSSHPTFFSNTGNSVFVLDRSGLFYFISGEASHCLKGEKMIIKVLGPDKTSPSPSNSQNNTTDTSDESGADVHFFCSYYSAHQAILLLLLHLVLV